MAGLIEKIFQISFKILGFKIDISDFVGTIRNLCNWNSITKTTIWSLASSIHSVIVPIGLSLLTLFFLLDMLIIDESNSNEFSINILKIRKRMKVNTIRSQLNLS